MQQGASRRWARYDARAFPSRSSGSVALATAVILGLALLVLVATVFGVQLAYAGRMYPGVRSLGVALGGQSRAEARTTLERRAAELAGRSLDIGYQELRWTVQGHHLGLQPDLDRALEDAYSLGRGGNLLSRFLLTFGLIVNGEAYEASSSLYDDAKVAAFMQALAAAVDRPVTDATLTVRPEGVVEVVDGLPGRRLRVEATRDRIQDAFDRPAVAHVDLVVDELAPQVSAADLADARGRAEVLLSGPLTVAAEDGEWQIPVDRLAAMTEVTSDRVVRLNGEAVKTWAEELAKDVNRPPQNARFDWTQGKLSLLRPSADGRELDVDRTVELVTARAFDSDRSIPLPIAVSRPDVSQDDGPKLQIKGLIDSARTSFAGSSPPKQHNIKLASERLNGVVVPPGKLFSFNREVGPTTLDAGFQLGWGITNAGSGNIRTVPAAAGGICQVATTLFHSVYWGGYQIEERHYHAYWIPGYTTKGIAGLDATVDDPYLDFRFWNNTDDYLLIQSWTEGASVVFGLYGTKPGWTVKVTPGEKTNVVAANRDQVTEEEASLPEGQRLAVEGAQDGFKIVNVRTVARGNDVRTLRLASFYRPSRNVVLLGTGGRPPRPSQTTPNQATRAAEPPRTTTGRSAGASSRPAPPAASTPAPAPRTSGDAARQTTAPAPRVAPAPPSARTP